MAKHFYSYQFDMPYKSTYLRNWEVSKYYCPKPRKRIGSTRIISNSRGHLLPGVPRPPCNPFGDFIGTWEMPRRITREVANKLNGSADKSAFMEACRRMASVPHRKSPRHPKKTEDTQQVPKSEEIQVPEAKEEDRTEVERVICPIHDF